MNEKMARFIYFQDMHLKGKNSRNRLGNYFQDCLAKLDEIIALAKEYKCEAILDGGDLFEVENPSYTVIDAIADKIEKAKISVYSLFGNHAMKDGHIENSAGTGLAHLQKRSKYFKQFIELDERDFKSENPFAIVGIDYDFGIEDELKTMNLAKYSHKGMDRWTVYILHAMVTPKKFFDSCFHVIAKDIQTNADLILVAHYHKPYELKIVETTFLNIGCCGRDNIDEAHIEPSVLLIDTEKKNWEIIKLKSAKKAEEIFDLTKYEEAKDSKRDIKEFLDSLRDVNFQTMDVGEQIVKIGKDQNVEQNVIDYLLKKIGKQNDG